MLAELKRIHEALEDVETKKEEVEEKVENQDRKDEAKVPEEKKVVVESDDDDNDDDDDDDDGEDDKEDEADDEKDDEEDDEEDEDDDSESDVEMEKDDKPHNSPSVKSLGDEKLASEYEQFMKMVATDRPTKSPSSSSKHSSKVTSSAAVSPSNYDDFNLEIDISNAKDYKFANQLPVAQSPKSKVKIEANRKKESLEIAGNADSILEPTTTLDECNEEPTEKETPEIDEEAPEENQNSDSRSIPSDWENVTIKVEQLSDENVEMKTLKKKKKQRSYSTSSESSSSSSSSDSDVKSKKRRKKKKIAKSSSDSDSSDSSSSDSSSSDEARKKKRKRNRKKKRVKKASRKARKRRSRKRVDSSSSDSDDTRKKKKKKEKKKKKRRLKRKKLKKKVVEENEEGVSKRKRKSSPGSLSRDMTVKRAHFEKVAAEGKKKRKKRLEKVKRVKLSNDLEKQILAKALSPDSVLLKECDMGKEQNLIQEQALARRQQKKRKRRQESEDKLSEWEKESILMTRQIEGIMDQSMSLDESPEREDIVKDEIGERKINKKSEDKSDILEAMGGEKVEEILEEGNFKSGGIPLTIELRGKEELETSEKEKSVSEELFLADWERESQRIAKVLVDETPDFDSLNVPSLTQLEEEVRKRDIFDEWEVDSLDAIRESPAKMKSSMKKEKVFYDEKTDTYITLQREGSKESKKKQERLSAIRIWEDEQEEGEREEMMLIKQKTKLKKEMWNTDEEFLKMRADKKTLEINTDDLLETNLSEEIIKNEKSKSSEESEDVVESPKKMELGEKRRKKSRWDVGNQLEDSNDIQMTPVMWEEESTDWQKSSGTETALLKLAKVKEQISSPILETLPGEIKLEVFNIPQVSSSMDLTDIEESADIFKRKLQQMRFSENTWISKDYQSPISSIEESELAGSKIEMEGDVKLKSIVEFQEQAPKNVDLYSPSSPPLSQRSEVRKNCFLSYCISYKQHYFL